MIFARVILLVLVAHITTTEATACPDTYPFCLPGDIASGFCAVSACNDAQCSNIHAALQDPSTPPDLVVLPGQQEPCTTDYQGSRRRRSNVGPSQPGPDPAPTPGSIPPTPGDPDGEDDFIGVIAGIIAVVVGVPLLTWIVWRYRSQAPCFAAPSTVNADVEAPRDEKADVIVPSPAPVGKTLLAPSPQVKRDGNKGAVIAPKDCKAMVSFNSGALQGHGTEYANDLAAHLTSNGVPTFCTGTYCPANPGTNWRDITQQGVSCATFLICMITEGWVHSQECKSETQLFQTLQMKNPNKIVVPVIFPDFDEKHRQDPSCPLFSMACIQQIPVTYEALSNGEWKTAVLHSVQVQ